MDITQRTLALDFIPLFKVTPPGPAAYPTLAPTGTDPADGGADGVIILDPGKQSPFNFGKFAFWASGTATSAFNAKLVGWTKVNGREWWPITLADLQCTLSATARTTGEKCVGGITVNSALVIANYEIMPADNGIQILKLDLLGLQRLQLVPGTVASGTVTSVNCGISGF